MATITFSGIASGIDTASLIEATLSQKRSARITPLENKISEAEQCNSAFGELKDKLNKLKDAAAKFRALNGSGVSMQALSSDETTLSASVSGSTNTGIYNITTAQLATNGVFSFASSTGSYGSADAVINENISGSAADRTVNITVGTGSNAENISIVLDNTTTLSDFVTKFNNQSLNAGASLVNRGTSANPDYVVMISAKNEGTEKGSISAEIGSAITSVGAFNDNTVREAQNALITVDGIAGTIERQSNSISDVIPGVTLTLNQIGRANVTVGVDSDSTVELIRDVVDSYNDIVNYIKENDAISEEDEEIVYGTLSKTSLDENILSSLRSTLSSLKGSGQVNILADLGITTERDGTLAFDENTCKSAIDKDATGAMKLLQNLGENLASTNGTIHQYTRYNGLLDLAVNANKTSITSYQSKISNIESELSKMEKSLTKRFASLESLMGTLQQQQASIAALFPLG